MAEQETALIIGAGSGAQRLTDTVGWQRKAWRWPSPRRNTDKLDKLVADTGAKAYQCDASRPRPRSMRCSLR